MGIRGRMAVLLLPLPRRSVSDGPLGVWLERSHMPDGKIDRVRRASATVTRVATISADGCGMRTAEHRRTFDSAAMAHAFTDERLRDLLSRTRDGRIYVWSPGMPLSVKGLADAKLPRTRWASRSLRSSLMLVPESKIAFGLVIILSEGKDRLVVT